jgi:hypothetical protein
MFVEEPGAVGWWRRGKLKDVRNLAFHGFFEQRQYLAEDRP